MKPRLYLETTIPSYLVARRSPLARIAADQQTTQDWWDFQRHEYDLFISEAVIEEISRGDARVAAQRVDLVRGLWVLRRTVETERIAERLLSRGTVPARAEQDAAHLALAAAHQMDYLLTWNCTHINNVHKEHEIAAACRAFGYACPRLCTPAELMPIDPLYEQEPDP